LLAGNAYYVPPSFESIATVTLSTASSTISFSSIPATYKSLQLRVMNVGSGAANGYVRVNGDTTAANYTAHILRGTGSAATATGYAGGGYSDGLILFEGTVATYPTVAIMDIIDYASTTKNKTARCFAGNDNNSTGGTVWLTAALWMNTSAINALVIATGSGSFSIGTTAALYGIKGA
jgi:hypothetical protein